MLFGHREVVMRCPLRAWGSDLLCVVRGGHRQVARSALLLVFRLRAGRASGMGMRAVPRKDGPLWQSLESLPAAPAAFSPLRAPRGRTGRGPRAIADRVGDGFAVAAAGGRGKQGHLVDALAPRGDEGRGTLRKAPGSREQAVIRGSPNGATHPSDGVSAAESIGGGGEPGELKHLSTRRKGHQQQSSGLRAGGRDSVSSGERTRTRPVASR